MDPGTASAVARESTMCQGNMAIAKAANNEVLSSLDAILAIRNTGKTAMLPKRAMGNLTANSFNPNMKVNAPERYMGMTAG